MGREGASARTAPDAPPSLQLPLTPSLSTPPAARVHVRSPSPSGTATTPPAHPPAQQPPQPHIATPHTVAKPATPTPQRAAARDGGAEASTSASLRKGGHAQQTWRFGELTPRAQPARLKLVDAAAGGDMPSVIRSWAKKNLSNLAELETISHELFDVTSQLSDDQSAALYIECGQSQREYGVMRRHLGNAIAPLGRVLARMQGLNGSMPLVVRTFPLGCVACVHLRIF